MTQSSQSTQQAQNSTSAPWAPAQPLLTNLLGQYGQMGTAVTPGQSQALSNLWGAASSIPNFGKSASGSVNNLLNANNTGNVGTLQTAYQTMQNNLAPVTNPANVNPYNTPGFSDAMDTMTSDATKAVKGVYAGSGRDPSGAGSFGQSLARGITQGEAPAIQAAYQGNVGNLMNANNALFGAGNTTATGSGALTTQALQNQLMGINAASAIPGLFTAPGQAQLGVANAAYSQPYSNLSQLLSPSTALAGLGGTSTGNMTGTTTMDPSLLSSLTGLLGAGGMAAGGLGSLLKLSDVRLKENIHPVGKLNDGQTVHAFKFKGMPGMHLGLLAHEVQQHAPHAVRTMPSGFKAVDYGAATARARAMGGDQVGSLMAPLGMAPLGRAA